jgi:hypothetical protein
MTPSFSPATLARATGYDTGGEDITFEWREW